MASSVDTALDNAIEQVRAFTRFKRQRRALEGQAQVAQGAGSSQTDKQRESKSVEDLLAASKLLESQCRKYMIKTGMNLEECKEQLQAQEARIAEVTAKNEQLAQLVSSLLPLQVQVQTIEKQINVQKSLATAGQPPNDFTTTVCNTAQVIAPTKSTAAVSATITCAADDKDEGKSKRNRQPLIVKLKCDKSYREAGEKVVIPLGQLQTVSQLWIRWEMGLPDIDGPPAKEFLQTMPRLSKNDTRRKLYFHWKGIAAYIIEKARLDEQSEQSVVSMLDAELKESKISTTKFLQSLYAKRPKAP